MEEFLDRARRLGEENPSYSTWSLADVRKLSIPRRVAVGEIYIYCGTSGFFAVRVESRASSDAWRVVDYRRRATAAPFVAQRAALRVQPSSRIPSFEKK